MVIAGLKCPPLVGAHLRDCQHLRDPGSDEDNVHDDSEGNAQGKAYGDLEERREDRCPKWILCVDQEVGDGCDTGKDVEKDACRLSHALAEPSRPMYGSVNAI
jgi:hypothetical protein